MFNARLCLPFSWVLFVKSWRSWSVLLAGLVVCAPLSAGSQQWMALSGIALTMVVFTLFNALTLVETQQVGASGFPTYLMQLPMSDTELVAWPMVITALSMSIVGIAFSTLIFGGLHGLRETWWIAPYLAGTSVLFQAAYWLPVRRPEWRMVLSLGTVFAIAGGPIALGFQIFDPIGIASAYGTILAGSIFATVRGVSKVRHGTIGLGFYDKPGYKIPDLPPFRSRVETQGWLEEQRNGRVMKFLTCMFLVLFAGFALVPMIAPDISEFQGQRLVMPLVVLAGLALVVPAYLAYGGCCGSEPDNLAKGRSIVPFMALRPLTDEQIFESKVRMALRVVFRLALLQIATALGILLVPVSVDGHREPTIVPLLHAVTPAQFWSALGVFAFLVFVGIKGAISTIWASLGRLSAIESAATGFVPMVVIAGSVVYVALHPHLIPAVLHYFPWFAWFAVLAKIGVLAWAVPQLRRRHLVSDNLIVKWLFGCLVAGVVLFAAGWWAIPAAIYNRPALAAQVLCYMPLARVALTPLFIHRGRHQ